MVKKLFILFFVIMLFSLTGNVFAENINTYHTNSEFKPSIKWSSISSQDILSIYIDKNTGDVFYTTKSGFIVIDKEGNNKWGFSKPNFTNFSINVSPTGIIYVLAHEVKYVYNGFDILGSSLYAFSQNGEIKWEYNLKSIDLSSQFAIDANDTVYLTSSSAKLYAIDKQGNQKWIFSKAEPGYDILNTPLIDNEGTIFVGTRKGIVYAVTSDGTLKNTINIGNYQKVTNIGITNDNYLLVNVQSTAGIRYIFEISREGDVKWKDWYYDSDFGGSYIVGNTKYLRTTYYNYNYDKLSAYVDSSEPVWDKTLNFKTTSGPILNSNYILIGSSSEKRDISDIRYGYTIHIFKKNGEAVEDLKINNEKMIIVNGFINGDTFIASSNNKIYAISLGNVSDLTPPSAPLVNEVTDRSSEVTGRGEVGSTITVKAGDIILGTATVKVDGTFTVSIQIQLEGTELSVTAADQAGNVGESTKIIVNSFFDRNNDGITDLFDILKVAKSKPEIIPQITTNYGKKE